MAQFTFGGERHQFAGHLGDPILDPGAPGLPARIAQFVEIGFAVFGAIARQQFQVLDRQEQLVIAGIDQAQTVMGRAADLEGFEPVIPGNAMFGMHHDIAERQARHF